MEYVDRVDSLLESLLSRESINETEKRCQHCEKQDWAVWRCKDCSLGITMCRQCIRHSHRNNPFHRIEKWTGKYFRPAALWEVGAYLLVRHHLGTQICDTLQRQVEFLESLEMRRDREEQKHLNATGHAAPHTAPLAPMYTNNDDTAAPEFTSAPNNVQTDKSDEEFLKHLDNLYENEPSSDDTLEGSEELEIEDDVADEETDPPDINRYLPNENATSISEEYTVPITIVGTYLRVVDINGIHNIAMINCECQGADRVAGDLLASRLLPTSFKRIRTLFTTQLLDYFRLSNLELKVSAYQFYHLLQRITAPMDPAGVVDLYRELRRLSRLWRWMKRLKWAGYPGNRKPVSEVKAGELSIFCAACPQPGINLPENWKADLLRQVFVLCFKEIVKHV